MKPHRGSLLRIIVDVPHHGSVHQGGGAIFEGGDLFYGEVLPERGQLIAWSERRWVDARALHSTAGLGRPSASVVRLSTRTSPASSVEIVSTVMNCRSRFT